ncbi:MAG: type 1 pili tip component [Gammaproteobacteria bacterium]
MSFRELLDIWQKTPRVTKTKREYAVRLPVEDAARLHALEELFDGPALEQIITDLLGAALDELEAAMPYEPGERVIREDEQGDPIYEDAGLTPRFIELARKHLRSLESHDGD